MLKLINHQFNFTGSFMFLFDLRRGRAFLVSFSTVSLGENFGVWDTLGDIGVSSTGVVGALGVHGVHGARTGVSHVVGVEIGKSF